MRTFSFLVAFLPTTLRGRLNIFFRLPRSISNFVELRKAEVQLLRISLLETVWKLLRTGQPPYHEPRHRHVDEGLSGSAKPLVVFGHPAVVGDPRKRALYYPPSRQDTKTPRRHEPLPVHLLTLLGPLPGPSLCHLLGHGLLGLAHHLHAHAQNLLWPFLSPPLVVCIDPQVRKARKATPHLLQQQPDAVLVGHPDAVNPCFQYQPLRVSPA